MEGTSEVFQTNPLQLATNQRTLCPLHTPPTPSYSELLFVTMPSKNMLEFNLVHEKLILFSPKAVQVKALIDHFIMELKKVRPYLAGGGEGRNLVGEGS